MYTMLVVFILVLMAVLWIQYRWKNRHIYAMARRLDSGLTALPILGHSYLFIGSNEETRMKIFQDIGRIALKHESGLIALWQVCTLYTVVADPVAAALITKSSLEKDSVFGAAWLYTGNGSIFAPVTVWRTRRKLIIHCFTTKIIKQFLPLITKNSEVLRQKLSKIAGTGTIPIWNYLANFSFDVNAGSVLGCELDVQNSEHPFPSALNFVMNTIAERICSPWLQNDLVFCHLPSSKKSLQMIEYIRQFVSKLITLKRKEIMERSREGDVYLPSQNAASLLELLIQYSKDGRSCTDSEISEELIIMLTAAIDSSLVTNAFTYQMLSRHPEVQQKVYDELQDIFGNSDRTATLDDLDRLKYLEITIKETLRLYPPGPLVARQIDEELTLPSGITILPGTNALINIWAIHRNPRYWGEDAEQFRPERFIEAPLKHPAAFMPFSFGPRGCVGYRYAMMSMKVTISTILRNFKILPPYDLPCSEQPPIRLLFDLIMKDMDKCQVRLEHRV